MKKCSCWVLVLSFLLYACDDVDESDAQIFNDDTQTEKNIDNKELRIVRKFNLQKLDEVPEGRHAVVYSNYEELEADLTRLQGRSSDEESDFGINQIAVNKMAAYASKSLNTQTKKTMFFPGTSLNWRMDFELSSGFGPYTYKKIKSVNTWLTGQTTIWDWSQTSWSKSFNSTKTSVKITVKGVENYYIITPLGFARLWSKNTSYKTTFTAP